jgi:hypothetical protein
MKVDTTMLINAPGIKVTRAFAPFPHLSIQTLAVIRVVTERT